MTFLRCALFLLIVGAPRLFAVEEASVLQRYFVVGVISAGERKTPVGSKVQNNEAVDNGAIAVIKDKSSQRSLLLRAGDQLPYSDHWRVFSIDRNHVFLTNDKEKVELMQFVEEEKKPVAAAEVSEISGEDKFDKYYSFRKTEDAEEEGAPVKPRVTAEVESVIQFRPTDPQKNDTELDAAEELGLEPAKARSKETATGNTSNLNPENYDANSFGNESENNSGGVSEYWQYDESEDDFYFE